jgi:hypothetical protein
MRRTSTRNGKSRIAGTLTSRQLTLIEPTAVAVLAMSDEPQPPPQRNIHPRRLLPPVRPGIPVADVAPSSAMRVEVAPMADARAVGAASDDEVAIVRTTELGQGFPTGFASAVGEPSVAIKDNIVFYTGNWYAAVSEDGGATFRFIDPANSFPDPPGMIFCCDQVVHYIPQIDTFVWSLQYSVDASDKNIQRVAFAKAADVVSGRWRFVDITPANLGLPDQFLDFPDLAFGTNMLYLTSNVFRKVGPGDDDWQWSAAVVARLPLSDIDSFLGGGSAPTAQNVTLFDFSGPRVAQQCVGRAVWAVHRDLSTLRIFSWPEAAAQASFQDVTIPSWVGGQGYQTVTPEGFNWLDRCDPRLVGACRRPGDEFWFAWSVDRGGANSRPHPYVQIARIDASTMTAQLVESINLWDPDVAVAYAALSTNSKGEVGVSYFVGGANRNPSHVVGMLTGLRDDVVVATGAHGPKDGQWGDYLTVRRNHDGNKRLFAATGYTLDRGTGRRDGNPRFVLFGRTGDLN